MSALAYTPNANIGILQPRGDANLPFGDISVQVVTAGFDVPDDGVILLWLDEVTSDPARATMVLESTTAALTNMNPGRHTLYAGMHARDQDETLGGRASVTFTVLEPLPPAADNEPLRPPAGVSNILFPSTPAMIIILSALAIGVLALLFKVIFRGDADAEESAPRQQE